MELKQIKVRISFVAVALFLLSVDLRSQSLTLNGIVLDDSTQQPLPYAHIYIKNSETNIFTGTISDLDGKFMITFKPQNLMDSLHITFVGYESRSIPVGKTKIGSSITIHLRRKDTYLPTAVFRDLTAEEFFLRCASRFESNYSNVAFLNTAFYWRAVAQADTFLVLDQTPLILIENNFHGKAKHSVSTKNKFEIESAYNALDSIENVLYFDQIKSGSGIMNKHNVDEWEFKYDTKIDIPENYVWLVAHRKDKLGSVRLLVNDETHAIEEVNFSLVWNSDVQHGLNDTLNYKLNKVSGKILYNRNEEKYNLKYFFIDAQYDLFKKNNLRKFLSRRIIHELVVDSSIEMNNPIQFDDFQEANHSAKKTIINLPLYCQAARALGIQTNFCP